jgi:thiosulfate/3-mercaptopyruvate sulfurtransferase
LNGGVDSPLITPSELSDTLDRAKTFDIRWSLTDPTYGTSAYESGHIPGAVFVDLDADLSGEGHGRHPLPTPEAFRTTLGRLGVGRDDHVVVYDDTGGTVASRMWWMLRSIGHQEVQVLDGGLHGWIGAGFPLASGHEHPDPATYPEVGGFSGVVTHAGLAGRMVVDVRAPERYRGDYEPVDPKAGHIPGAVNLPLADNLGSDGCLLAADDLARRYAGVAPDPVLSCGSGVNACHAALAMEVAGLGIPDIYIGSFSDWSARDLPVRTGDRP